MGVKLSSVGIILVLKFWDRSVFHLGIEGKIDFPRGLLWGITNIRVWSSLSRRRDRLQEHLPVKESQSNTHSLYNHPPTWAPETASLALH